MMQIKAAKEVGADIVELHTGHFCDLFEKSMVKEYTNYLKKLEDASKYASYLGLEVHAGHGLTVNSVKHLRELPQIRELNIGHSIISDSITPSLERSCLFCGFPQKCFGYCFF